MSFCIAAAPRAEASARVLGRHASCVTVRTMLPKRTLRASFVVTVASGALVGMGCGSTVVQAPDGQAPVDVSDRPDGATPPDTVDPWPDMPPPINPPPPDVPDAAVASCPPSAPAQGGACDPSLSRICTYGDCLGRPTIEARCAGGAWSVVESTCNPPPPEPCPSAPPTGGAACTYTGPGCTYGMCPPSSTTFAMCVSGRWSVGIASCNPPLDAGPPPDA